MEEQAKFNGDLLRYKSLEDYVAFKNLHDLINSKKAIEAHLETYNLYALDPSLHDEGTDKALRGMISADILAALNHFGGLTIISLCTTYEIAVRDFLTCFFVQQPSHMYEFVGADDMRGHVSLKDILKVDTYQGLMNSLAKSAASVASKGKYGQSLARIANLCKEDVDKELAKKLDDIQKLRNKIVHEKHTRTWDLADIQETEELISAVIEKICHYGLNNRVPGNYTCVSNEYSMVVKSIAGLTNEEI